MSRLPALGALLWPAAAFGHGEESHAAGAALLWFALAFGMLAAWAGYRASRTGMRGLRLVQYVAIVLCGLAFAGWGVGQAVGH